MQKNTKTVKYTITTHARQGYDNAGKWLHVSGLDNIISFIIWHLLDIELAKDEDIPALEEKCVKRINYVFTPKRVTASLALDEETKERFKKMYVNAGIGSLSAAIDLLGIALNPVPDNEIMFTNHFRNPFFLFQDGNRVSVRAHGIKPILSREYFVPDDDGVLRCTLPDLYNVQVEADEHIDFLVKGKAAEENLPDAPNVAIPFHVEGIKENKPGRIAKRVSAYVSSLNERIDWNKTLGEMAADLYKDDET